MDVNAAVTPAIAFRAECTRFYFEGHPDSAEVMQHYERAKVLVWETQSDTVTVSVGAAPAPAGLTALLDAVGFLTSPAGLRMLTPQQLTEYEGIKNQVRAHFHRARRQQQELTFRSTLVQLLSRVPVPPGDAPALVEYTPEMCAQLETELRPLSAQAGCQPVIRGLRELLEAQLANTQNNCCVWSLDDGVLVESGGEDFMRFMLDVLVLRLRLCVTPVPEPVPVTSAATGDERLLIVRHWRVPATVSDVSIRRVIRALPRTTHFIGSTGTLAASTIERSNRLGHTDVAGAVRWRCAIL